MENNSTQYKTHWHSFWFGFMVALSITLISLLILVISNRISFGPFVSKESSTQKVPPTETNKSDSATIEKLVASVGVDVNAVRTCALDKKFAKKVSDDRADAVDAGAKGTPHSYVMIAKDIYEIPGAYDENSIRTLLDELLAHKTPKDFTNVSTKVRLNPITDIDWVKGDNNAQITFITYSDVDCPYCKQFHTTIKKIMPDYHDSVRWVFRHMPSDTLHPHSREKAETAECIGSIGGTDKFWEFLDVLFAQK